VVEIGYRAHLVIQNPFLRPTFLSHVTHETDVPVNAFTRPFWRFDAVDGYDFAAIETLKQTCIPYIVIHLPVAPELKSNKEYWDPAVEEIAQELSRLTGGKPVYGLLDYMPLPVENPERIAVTEID
jgi:hypothetical protein